MSSEEIREFARRLGSLPKKKAYHRTCVICGTEFDTTRRGIYCSMRCRAKAQQNRLREARRAEGSKAP